METSRKKTTEYDREKIKEIKASCNIDQENLFAKFVKISKGDYVPENNGISENGSSDSFIDTASDNGEIQSTHINFDEFFDKFSGNRVNNKKVSSNKSMDMGHLNPLVNELCKVKFSSSDIQSEIEIMKRAIQAGQEMIEEARSERKISKIVDNTKKVLSTAHKFFQNKTSDGAQVIRVEFSVLGQKYSFAAKGNFDGNECLWATVEGDNVVGHVMRRREDGSFDKVGSQFEISVTKGWKS